VPGHTVVPRNALAVINKENCVFVQSPDKPDKFERRVIEIDQERSDHVVVRSGINAGERVVTNGSLILSQLYEDQSTVYSGLPL
jgi:cobalt-zinc-cadmium efflux system membrane fusion protein